MKKQFAASYWVVSVAIAVSGAAFARVRPAAPGTTRLDTNQQFDQTQGDVAVRLEKVTVERIYNINGFLAKHYPAEDSKKAAGRMAVEQMAAGGPLRLVSVFLTYRGPIQKIAIRVEHPEFEPRLGGQIAVSDNWQRRLAHLRIENRASGSEIYAIVPPEVSLSELFPCEIRCTLTKRDNREATFNFRNVRF